MSGTQLLISVVRSDDYGTEYLAFFQETGNDLSLYIRDAYNELAPWSKVNNTV